MILSKKSFTLIEVVIVMAILSTMMAVGGFGLKHIFANANSVSDKIIVNKLNTSMTNILEQNHILPYPDSHKEIVYTGDTGKEVMWLEGTVGSGVITRLPDIQKVPKQSFNNENYRFSVSANRSQFQLLTLGEKRFFEPVEKTQAYNLDGAYPYIKGKYKGHIDVNPKGMTGLRLASDMFINPIGTGKIEKQNSIIIEKQIFQDVLEGTGTNTFIGQNHSLGEDINHYRIPTNRPTVNEEGLLERKIIENKDYLNKFQKDFEKLDINYYEDIVDSNNLKDEILKDSDDEYKVRKPCEYDKILNIDYFDHGTVRRFYATTGVKFGNNCESISQNFNCNDGSWLPDKNVNEGRYPTCKINDGIAIIDDTLKMKGQCKINIDIKTIGDGMAPGFAIDDGKDYMDWIGDIFFKQGSGGPNIKKNGSILENKRDFVGGGQFNGNNFAGSSYTYKGNEGSNNNIKDLYLLGLIQPDKNGDGSKGHGNIAYEYLISGKDNTLFLQDGDSIAGINSDYNWPSSELTGGNYLDLNEGEFYALFDFDENGQFYDIVIKIKQGECKLDDEEDENLDPIADILLDHAVFALGDYDSSIVLNGGSVIKGHIGTNSNNYDQIQFNGGSKIEGNIAINMNKPDQDNTWDKKKVYNNNETVWYDGVKYMQNYWTKNDRPDINSIGLYDKWQRVIPKFRQEDELKHINEINFPEPTFPTFPNSLESKGDFNTDWNEEGYWEINESGDYNSINITSNRTLTFDMQNQDKTIRVNDFNVQQGHINLKNASKDNKLKIYIDNSFTLNGDSSLNKNGSTNNIEIYYAGTNKLSFGGATELNAHLNILSADLEIGGSNNTFGNITSMGDSIDITGAVNGNDIIIYAPKSDLKLSGGAKLNGATLVKSAYLDGNVQIEYNTPFSNTILGIQNN